MARKEGPKAKLGWLMPDNGEFVFEPHAGPNRIAAEAVLAAVESICPRPMRRWRLGS